MSLEDRELMRLNRNEDETRSAPAPRSSDFKVILFFVCLIAVAVVGMYYYGRLP